MVFSDQPSTTNQHAIIQNCAVQYGSQLGDDASLNWDLAIHSSNNSVVRNNRVRDIIINSVNAFNFNYNTRCSRVYNNTAHNVRSRG